MRRIAQLAGLFLLGMMVGTASAQTKVQTVTKDCSAGCTSPTLSFGSPTTAGNSIVVSVEGTLAPISVTCGSLTLTNLASTISSAHVAGQNFAGIYVSKTYQDNTSGEGAAAGGYVIASPSVSSCTVNNTASWTGAAVMYETTADALDFWSACTNTALGSGCLATVSPTTTTTGSTAIVTGGESGGVANELLFGVLGGFPNTPTISGVLTTTDFSTTSTHFDSGSVSSTGTYAYTGTWASGTGSPTGASLAVFIQPTPPTLPTPTFSAPNGNYGALTLSMSVYPSIGAAIHYSTTGTATCSSALYTAPISVASGTVTAIACAPSWTNSATNSSTYAITGVMTPTTYYIRTDGAGRYDANRVSAGLTGSDIGCNGTTDAAYPGGGLTNQNCAFNDFRFMWDDQTFGNSAWLSQGGDTVVIRGCTASGSQVNPDNPHCRIGSDNSTFSGGTTRFCNAVSAYQGCSPPPPPSGTSSQHTRIIGGCAFGTYTCTPISGNYPYGTINEAQIFGGFGDQTALFLGMGIAYGSSGSGDQPTGSQYVDIEGLEITTHNALTAAARSAWSSGTTYGNTDSVTFGGSIYASLQAGNTGHNPSSSPTWWIVATQCTRVGQPEYPTPCSNSSPVDDYANAGILTNTATSNITLQDTYIHGVTTQGMGGAIGGPFTLTRVSIDLNAFAGWNFDDGNATPDIPTSTITQSYVTMIGNGFLEQYPIINTAFPALAGWDTTTGGFGDAWSGQNTYLASFTCDRCYIAYNTKDAAMGPHSLIHNLSLTNSTFIANMGQDGKWGQDPNATFVAENDLFVGNCFRMSAALTGAPSNYNQFLSGFCRAAGGLFDYFADAGSSVLFENNSWVTYQPTILTDGCTTFGACGAEPYLWVNNLILGYTTSPSYYPNTGQAPGLYASTEPSVVINASNAIEFGIRDGDPCTGTILCVDPLLVGEPAQGSAPPPESAFDNFNFNLTSLSPAIHAGTTPCPTTDFAGNAQTSPCTIGAYIFTGGVSPTKSRYTGTVRMTGSFRAQ